MYVGDKRAAGGGMGVQIMEGGGPGIEPWQASCSGLRSWLVDGVGGNLGFRLGWGGGLGVHLRQGGFGRGVPAQEGRHPLFVESVGEVLPGLVALWPGDRLAFLPPG